MVVEPYTDTDRVSNTFTRVFECNLDNEELVWHRDRKDRLVKVKSGVEWQLQMDDELPVELLSNHIYFIEAKRYHRLIKGTGNLILEIKEDE